MSENTNISWCHSTWNPWIGCQKVSPACDRCYAETWAKRVGRDFSERKHTSVANWRLPHKWNRLAAKTGQRHLVFCASLADVFDNQAPAEWRHELWRLILATPHLTWQLLTKRVGNVASMVPADWMNRGFPPHVWLGISVCNQQEYDRDVPKLRSLPAAIRWLSIEPLLGGINLTIPGIDWVVIGGESGSSHRTMSMSDARSIIRQCQEQGIAIFIKQDSHYRPGHPGRFTGEEFSLRQLPR